MEEEEEEEVVIVGAGITGLATALALHRVGVRSLVLEKSEELRATGSALYLFPNAWLALDALQISHKLTPFYPPLTSGSVTDLSTGSVHQIFSGDGEEGPRVVHRKALLEALAKELPPESIRFSSQLTSIQKELGDDDASLVVARLKDGTAIKSKVYSLCFFHRQG
ncbi:Monooxygenase 3 [Linum grandiflorum]